MQKIVAPELRKRSFHCPHCNTFAHQNWKSISSDFSRVEEIMLSYCSYCNKYSIWYNDTMLFPSASGIQPPNEDLTEEIINDYLEAASIVNSSPRGSAALLRLALQKLCIELGENKNIDKAIGSLVTKGLSPTIQKALDIVRVVGNEAVHPGQIDFKDNKEVALKLFELINFIAHKMITEPKEIETLYETLPEEKREFIETRDKNAMD
jgi:hypothetical protein